MQVFFLISFGLIVFAEVIEEKTAVLILARGGSKGIRLKNLQAVGGLSLLNRAIRTAKIAGIRDVTVSTDHPLIALESIKNIIFNLTGGARVFHRSPITATDWAPSIWGTLEFLSSKPHVEILILLQATSPFVEPTNLIGALRKLTFPIPFDCIFSATRSYKLRWKPVSIGVTPINFDPNARPRRQDWSGELLETGAFYMTRRNVVMSGSFQNHK
ncbi:N-acylneuraminate cytidylyltransferase [Cydia pomonella]|uniref:N-acylneuraminate cytidylyltransferase n=1 Tax=Cydia pomonella TaxID=82600 RepID=UPI002ADE68C9|nr:N-acylneuraminate cytidylyltransferase [Cydia pomonella]